MTMPITIHAELLVPARVLQDGRMPDQVERWLQAAGLLPPTVHGCCWRSDPERYGYVVSFDVTVLLGAKQHVSTPPKPTALG